MDAEGFRLMRNAAVHADQQSAELGLPTSIHVIPFGIQVRCNPMPGRFSAVGNMQHTINWDAFMWSHGDVNPIKDVIDLLHLNYINHSRINAVAA